MNLSRRYRTKTNNCKFIVGQQLNNKIAYDATRDRMEGVIHVYTCTLYNDVACVCVYWMIDVCLFVFVICLLLFVWLLFVDVEGQIYVHAVKEEERYGGVCG